MALSPGARFGVYHVVGPLGRGGMGEVWRATDTKLHRDVALKILPDAFAHDPERLARFEREARTLASLNHPNIAQVYGLEESLRNGPAAPPVQAIVMELVEGPTLADRIAQGPLPIDEALPIAKQIAEALEAAHEHGIVHRDLKPANIKLRPDGTVKVLDFGLAKTTPAAVSGSGSMSPTITTPAMTQAGMILGTAAYMSPEQARGKPVDKRADIWAFGCVFYEMLTGRRAFGPSTDSGSSRAPFDRAQGEKSRDGGEDVTQTLAEVLKSDVNWDRVPRDVPSPIRRLLRRALKKDPRERLADAGDARLEIEDAIAAAPDGVREANAANHASGMSPFVVAGLVAAAVLTTGAGVWLAVRAGRPRQSLLPLIPPNGPPLTVGDGRSFTFTDNSTIAYGSGSQIVVRSLDSLEPEVLLDGGENPTDLFASPDGTEVGFFDSNTLRRATISGRSSRDRATLVGPYPLGAAWAPDGSIVLATTDTAVGLVRVSAAGVRRTLTMSDPSAAEQNHAWPELLPDGRILFTILSTSGELDDAQVAVVNLNGTNQQVLFPGRHAHYVQGGHLLYFQGGSLWVRSVDLSADLSRDQFEAPPRRVADAVRTTATGNPEFDVAADVFAYVTQLPDALETTRSVLRVNPETAEVTGRVPLPPKAYAQPKLSLDDELLAIVANGDIWTWDFGREVLRQFTSHPEADACPVWTGPREDDLVFCSRRDGGVLRVYRGRSAERLGEDEFGQVPTSASRDGRILLHQGGSGSGFDIKALNPSSRQLETLVASPEAEGNAALSPDQKWLAFQRPFGNEPQVWIRPYGNPDAAGVQVSTDGGGQPVWSRDSSHLYYKVPGGKIVRVEVSTAEPGGDFRFGRETVVATGVRLGLQEPAPYDVMIDGHLLVIRDDPGASQIIVGQYWLQELSEAAD